MSGRATRQVRSTAGVLTKTGSTKSTAGVLAKTGLRTAGVLTKTGLQVAMSTAGVLAKTGGATKSTAGVLAKTGRRTRSTAGVLAKTGSPAAGVLAKTGGEGGAKLSRTCFAQAHRPAWSGGQAHRRGHRAKAKPGMSQRAPHATPKGAADMAKRAGALLAMSLKPRQLQSWVLWRRGRRSTPAT